MYLKQNDLHPLPTPIAKYERSYTPVLRRVLISTFIHGKWARPRSRPHLTDVFVFVATECLLDRTGARSKPKTASGKATISLNRKVEGGSVQEVDIKDIKPPNYFGEGRVLGDSRAYASVRAKEELVVYYIMRADIEELVRYAYKYVLSSHTQLIGRRRQARRCWLCSVKLSFYWQTAGRQSVQRKIPSFKPTAKVGYACSVQKWMVCGEWWNY